MKSGHENPKLAEIDRALSKLVCCIESQAFGSGYIICRSDDGVANIPRRWINRTTELDGRRVSHRAEIVIAVPIDVRLKHGFYSGIPLAITAVATLRNSDDPFNELIICKSISKSLPYEDASEQLPGLFDTIKSLHDMWNAGFIEKRGETIDEFIASCGEESA